MQKKLTRSVVGFFAAATIAIVTGFLILAAFRPPHDTAWTALLTGLATLTIGTFLFAILYELQRNSANLAQRNKELFALYKAGLDLHGRLSAREVLQNVVDRARDLLDARYGAISVIDADDQILEFIVSGVSDELRERIGPPPRGHGLLGVPLESGERLRVADIERDPRSAGIPEHHPPMHSLLAVPLECSELRGNLYLAEKETAATFSLDDEESLSRFARIAAIAIDTAHRHGTLTRRAVTTERSRIARELHDRLAQDLAAVSLRAGTMRSAFTEGDLDRATSLLSEIESSSRLLQRDIREEIGGLASPPETATTFEECVRHEATAWAARQGIPVDLTLPDETPAAPEAVLQLQRIVQESLANVARHSGASEVRIRSHRHDHAIDIEIADDGRGMSGSAAQGRFGQRIMRERAADVGGELSIDSTPGAGTRILCRLPVGSEVA